jgi:hypothetical protein
MASTKINIGDRFGKLTVINFAGHVKNSKGYNELIIKCKCDCGNIAIVKSTNLLRGYTKSCGCYKAEKLKEIHSGNNYGYKHGGSNEKLYFQFTTMHNRGEVCDEWSGENGYINYRKWAYENGYNPEDNKVLTRNDNSKPYSPDNCKWVYRSQVITSQSKLLTYNGETRTISEWASKLGIPFTTLENRLINGWPIAKALSTPVEKKVNYINHNGNNYSIADWCYTLGLTPNTVSSRIERGATDPAKILKHPQKGCINAIYFIDENERPINQQDYADGIRVGRKAY